MLFTSEHARSAAIAVWNIHYNYHRVTQRCRRYTACLTPSGRCNQRPARIHLVRAGHAPDTPPESTEVRMVDDLSATRLLQNPLGQPAPDGQVGDLARISNGQQTIYLLPRDYDAATPAHLRWLLASTR